MITRAWQESSIGSCRAGFHKLPHSVFRKIYPVPALCPVFGSRRAHAYRSFGVAVATQIIAVVATVVAARFTDGGFNEEQRFEIDGHR